MLSCHLQLGNRHQQVLAAALHMCFGNTGLHGVASGLHGVAAWPKALHGVAILVGRVSGVA